MKENMNSSKINSSVRMPLNDTQLSSITGGMYHGYLTDEQIARGYYMIDGITYRVDGKRVVYGPGMVNLPPEPKIRGQNPMIELRKREEELEANLGGFAPFHAYNHYN